ncbi:kinase-like protein, partial [Polyplosphaeria fusca]
MSSHKPVMAQLMNIAPAELEARLSSFFPSADQRTAYTDPEIDEIASLLGLLGSCAARSPRIFIVLRMIGSLNRLHELLEHGFEDVWLPVERHSLPPSFPPHVRSDFVKAQAAVLTKSINLENGRHCHFSVDEPRPFEIQRRLGSGAYSQSFLGILMSPVAEMDLKSFLERLCANMKASIALDGVQQEISSLRAFFGCLAASISFLHDNRIRHKDLKPQNILIAGGTVVLTDFGLSRHFTDGQGSTTSGPTSATPRYSPPEVAAQESRNTSGDIWSLGCVFVEMGAALQGVSIDNIKEIFESEGTK